MVKSILGRPEPVEPATVATLVAQLQLPEAIAAILVRRGHGDPDAAKAFLRPQLESLHDPWTLPDMETAVERIASAIDDGEPILVHGDYDVDGVCGTTLLTRALRELGARVEPFVPNRLKDGYDFGPAGLAAALERDCRLVLTCDCGIAAHETVTAARDAGIDVVVSDHHTPPPELPPAVAVLNPHREDSAYPEKVLCGAGVAFKLLQALFERRGRAVQDLYKYLDLVGIPTIADLVPLTGENRILARFGLKVLERTPNPGLRALLRVSGLKAGRPISAGQIAFVIGPRINAVGRMGEAMRGVKLLLMEDEAEATAIADVVEAENRLRREVDRATLEEAKAILEESFDPESQRAIVLASQDWHPGVIGIVASRIVEQYYRPTVLIALDGDRGRGSGRSIPGLRLAPQDLLRTIRIDHEIAMTEVSSELWRFLAHFGPYGQGNPKPVFLARGVTLRGAPELVGQEHLRLRIEVGDGATPEAIAFGQAAELEWLSESSCVDLTFQIGVREWQGVEYVQAQVLDVRPSEAAWASSES